MTTKYRVIWDNGHASGTLPGSHDTEEAANDAGEDWRAEMCRAEDIEPDSDEAYEAYNYDVEEFEE